MDTVISLPPNIDLFGESFDPADLIGLSSSPASPEEDPAKAGRDFEEQMKSAGSDRVRLSLLMGRATTLTQLGRKQNRP